MDQPKLILLGGANGSGKTTLAREYISVEGFKYLGADQIAYELNPGDVESVAIEAGRLFVRRIEESIESRESIIVESTLSGLSLRKWIIKASDEGYHVTLLFVFLSSPEVCIQRIVTRVAKGGHHVPDEDVIRRWSRSNRNFWECYKNLANEWSLFNNDDESIVQIAASNVAGLTILEEERFSRWQRITQ